MKLFRHIFHIKNLFSNHGKRLGQSDNSLVVVPTMTIENIYREHDIPVTGSVCHLTTASGAKWASYSDGYAKLIKSHGLPLDTAIRELLQLLDLPTRLVLTDMNEGFDVVRHLVHSSAFNGCVFIGELQKAYYGESDTRHSCRKYNAFSRDKSNAKKKDAS
jgi:hypothetical protein